MGGLQQVAGPSRHQAQPVSVDKDTHSRKLLCVPTEMGADVTGVTIITPPKRAALLTMMSWPQPFCPHSLETHSPPPSPVSPSHGSEAEQDGDRGGSRRRKSLGTPRVYGQSLFPGWYRNWGGDGCMEVLRQEAGGLAIRALASLPLPGQGPWGRGEWLAELVEEGRSPGLRVLP